MKFADIINKTGIPGLVWLYGVLAESPIHLCFAQNSYALSKTGDINDEL